MATTKHSRSLANVPTPQLGTVAARGAVAGLVGSLFMAHTA